jgi:hypothetical protein
MFVSHAVNLTQLNHGAVIINVPIMFLNSLCSKTKNEKSNTRRFAKRPIRFVNGNYMDRRKNNALPAVNFFLRSIFEVKEILIQFAWNVKNSTRI